MLLKRNGKGDSEHASLSDVLCPNQGTCIGRIISQWVVCKEKEVRERRDRERKKRRDGESRQR